MSITEDGLKQVPVYFSSRGMADNFAIVWRLNFEDAEIALRDGVAACYAYVRPEVMDQAILAARMFRAGWWSREVHV